MKYFYAHIKSASGATGLQITRADKENDLRKLIEDKRKPDIYSKYCAPGTWISSLLRA